jgi:hypothetical protein
MIFSLNELKQLIHFHFIEKYPLLYHFRNHKKAIYRALSVKKDTQIAIQGYPRSANTFATVAFEYAQAGPVKIAHHLHSPNQVIRAVKWGIPTLVLIRDPIDAIASYLIRENFEVNTRFAIQRYIHFYQTVWPYRDGFIIGHFDDVTNHYEGIILRINKKFGTHFLPFLSTKDNKNSVFERIDAINKRQGDLNFIDSVARPDHERGLKKKYVTETIKADAENRKILTKAEVIFHDFIKCAESFIP